MSQAYEHHPVMLDEVVELFSGVPPGLVLDMTAGGGGHSAALLSSSPGLRVVAIDRDEEAVTATKARLAPWGGRAVVAKGRFEQIGDLVAAQGPVSGVLFDLGVSSAQLDRAERGFSYRADAPLDMRMDRAARTTAYDVVNSLPEDSLVRVLQDNGERRFARRIARAIVRARPLDTTLELAEVVREAIPAAARRQGRHPARRAFQAIRIEVNSELEMLGAAIDTAIDLLRPGGRCVVLSYHSGEDRIVKETFARAATGGCTCPPGLPCVCGARPRARLLNRRARRPRAEEVAANPRAESARLRAVERVSGDERGGSGSSEGSAGRAQPRVA